MKNYLPKLRDISKKFSEPHLKIFNDSTGFDYNQRSLKEVQDEERRFREYVKSEEEADKILKLKKNDYYNSKTYAVN